MNRQSSTQTCAPERERVPADFAKKPGSWFGGDNAPKAAGGIAANAPGVFERVSFGRGAAGGLEARLQSQATQRQSSPHRQSEPCSGAAAQQEARPLASAAAAALQQRECSPSARQHAGFCADSAQQGPSEPNAEAACAPGLSDWAREQSAMVAPCSGIAMAANQTSQIDRVV